MTALKSPPAHKTTGIEARCAATGMRMTEQRRVIARVLADSVDHPDVEELYRRCVAVDDKISISTVYRTVKLFEDAGIIERHDFREGRARYEQMRDSHHDHLINLRDGKVIEFTSEEIEKLQAEIARKLGYKLVDHRLELYCVPLDDDKDCLSFSEVRTVRVKKTRQNKILNAASTSSSSIATACWSTARSSPAARMRRRSDASRLSDHGRSGAEAFSRRLRPRSAPDHRTRDGTKAARRFRSADEAGRACNATPANSWPFRISAKRLPRSICRNAWHRAARRRKSVMA